jgi:hypothetical protein
MNHNLLETRRLKDGMVLYLCDCSRRQTEDRSIVVMEARLEIPVNEKTLASDGACALELETVLRVLGSRVTFVSRKERIFVADSDKAQLLDTFREEFSRRVLPYLSNPAFPSRFIFKEYQEARKRQSLQEAMSLNPEV